MEIKKILFPTDFSDASKNALEYAIYLKQKFGAELQIAHVIFDETYLVTMYVPQATLQGFLGELESGAKTHLDEFLDACEELKGVEYSKVMLRGTPYIEITKYAEEANIDIIVIGTHGRTGLEHMLFGSTTEKVIGRAKCPVLTVKPNKPVKKK